MIRCVAFDFDGTLVDSNTIKRKMAYEVVASIANGSSILDKVYCESPGADRYMLFRRFAELAAAEDVCAERCMQWARELAAEYTYRCEEAVSNCSEIPDAQYIIATLRGRGIHTTINSATPTDALRAIVARRGWTDFFSHVLGAPASKSENLGHLAKAMGLDPTEMAMVGDKVGDQVGAEKFGCHFVALLRPDSDFPVEPRLRASELAQLPSIIKQLNELS